ncbi:acyl-CoA thioesterase [Cytophagaceae bacterium ABcell3]|nr:acyl-CoA thioesterase [Cytophagaceae bacterium ABcell3]
MDEATVKKRIEESTTSIFKAVFPNTTNHYDTLFGGTAMQMMDEVAFITATRFCRKKIVTISSDKINFTKPIPAGTIIELRGRVSRVGKTSMTVSVEVFVEEMFNDGRDCAINGSFTFVAIGENKKAVRIIE